MSFNKRFKNGACLICDSLYSFFLRKLFALLLLSRKLLFEDNFLKFSMFKLDRFKALRDIAELNGLDWCYRILKYSEWFVLLTFESNLYSV
jgi:hypothetical protein